MVDVIERNWIKQIGTVEKEQETSAWYVLIKYLLQTAWYDEDQWQVIKKSNTETYK